MAERMRHFDQLSRQQAGIGSLDNLDEILGWLGTFRERLRQARDSDRPEYEAMLNQLEARYKERRAELA